MRDWYYEDRGHEAGPVDLEDLKDLVRSGRITRRDLVWSDGMGGWRAASTVEALFPKQLPPPLPSRYARAAAERRRHNRARRSGGAATDAGGPRRSDTIPPSSVAGLVFAFFGCAPIGLLFSIVALSATRRQRGTGRILALLGTIANTVVLFTLGIGSAIVATESHRHAAEITHAKSRRALCKRHATRRRHHDHRWEQTGHGYEIVDGEAPDESEEPEANPRGPRTPKRPRAGTLPRDQHDPAFAKPQPGAFSPYEALSPELPEAAPRDPFQPPSADMRKPRRDPFQPPTRRTKFY